MLETQIEARWENVRKLRGSVSECLERYSSELKSSAVMAASELVENAIKYGTPQPNGASIEFSLGIQDGQVCITVANPCTDLEKRQRLEERIRRMNSKASGNLYLKRLEELLLQPEQSPHLGLYRVGFEGNFHLEYSYNNQNVVVKATRSIS